MARISRRCKIKSIRGRMIQFNPSSWRSYNDNILIILPRIMKTHWFSNFVKTNHLLSVFPFSSALMSTLCSSLILSAPLPIPTRIWHGLQCGGIYGCGLWRRRRRRECRWVEDNREREPVVVEPAAAEGEGGGRDAESEKKKIKKKILSRWKIHPTCWYYSNHLN